MDAMKARRWPVRFGCRSGSAGGSDGMSTTWRIIPVSK